MPDLWNLGVAVGLFYGAVRAWPRSTPEAVAARVARFAEDHEEPTPGDVAAVNRVLLPSEYPVSGLYALLGILILAWTADSVRLVVAAVVMCVVATALALGMMVHRIGRLEGRSADGERVPVADFMSVWQRANPWALVAASAVAAVGSAEPSGRLLAGLGALAGLALVGVNRWLFRLRFTPRDEAHAHLLDWLRARVVGRETFVPVVWLLLFAAAGDDPAAWKARAALVVLVPLIGAVVAIWSRTPRYVQRRATAPR